MPSLSAGLPTGLLALLVILNPPALASPSPDELVRNETIQTRWIDSETLEFRVETANGPRKRVISAVSGKIRDAADAETRGHSLRPVRADRSRGQGTDIQLQFVNGLDVSLELFWIDQQGGRRSYGTIPSGQSRDQQTFGGHAWALVDPDGRVVAEFVAKDTDGLAVVDGEHARRPLRGEGAVLGACCVGGDAAAPCAACRAALYSDGGDGAEGRGGAPSSRSHRARKRDRMA